MSIVKRQDDAASEDYTGQRHPPIDWRNIAPRWLLVTTIGVLLFSLGWAISSNQNLSDDRIARMERYQSDGRWGLLMQYGADIALLRGDIRDTKARLEKIEGMADDVRKVRIMLEAETARRKRNGGYGL